MLITDNLAVIRNLVIRRGEGKDTEKSFDGALLWETVQ